MCLYYALLDTAHGVTLQVLAQRGDQNLHRTPDAELCQYLFFWLAKKVDQNLIIQPTTDCSDLFLIKISRLGLIFGFKEKSQFYKKIFLLKYIF